MDFYTAVGHVWVPDVTISWLTVIGIRTHYQYIANERLVSRGDYFEKSSTSTSDRTTGFPVCLWRVSSQIHVQRACTRDGQAPDKIPSRFKPQGTKRPLETVKDIIDGWKSNSTEEIKPRTDCYRSTATVCWKSVLCPPGDGQLRSVLCTTSFLGATEFVFCRQNLLSRKIVWRCSLFGTRVRTIYARAQYGLRPSVAVLSSPRPSAVSENTSSRSDPKRAAGTRVHDNARSTRTRMTRTRRYPARLRRLCVYSACLRAAGRTHRAAVFPVSAVRASITRGVHAITIAAAVSRIATRLRRSTGEMPRTRVPQPRPGRPRRVPRTRHARTYASACVHVRRPMPAIRDRNRRC